MRTAWVAHNCSSSIDISERWNPQEKNNDQLPKNVIENLRKVVNADGMLSFERFCAGLKIAILRHEAMKNKIVSTSSPSGDVDKVSVLFCIWLEDNDILPPTLLIKTWFWSVLSRDH